MDEGLPNGSRVCRRSGRGKGQDRLRERVLTDEKGAIVLSVQVGGTPVYICHCECQDHVVPSRPTPQLFPLSNHLTCFLFGLPIAHLYTFVQWPGLLPNKSGRRGMASKMATPTVNILRIFPLVSLHFTLPFALHALLALKLVYGKFLGPSASTLNTPGDVYIEGINETIA
jgi:hypothetical protein